MCYYDPIMSVRKKSVPPFVVFTMRSRISPPNWFAVQHRLALCQARGKSNLEQSQCGARNSPRRCARILCKKSRLLVDHRNGTNLRGLITIISCAVCVRWGMWDTSTSQMGQGLYKQIMKYSNSRRLLESIKPQSGSFDPLRHLIRHPGRDGP
jgi:hypothetical protein